MKELVWYANKIGECQAKIKDIESNLTTAKSIEEQSMLRYDLWLAEMDLETWDEMARERGVYII